MASNQSRKRPSWPLVAASLWMLVALCLMVFFYTGRGETAAKIVEDQKDNEFAEFLNVNNVRQRVEGQRQTEYFYEITDEVHRKWLPILRHEPISSITPKVPRELTPPPGAGFAVAGLADKFMIRFENGLQALAKYVEPPFPFTREWSRIQWSQNINDNWSFSQCDRKMQGANEIIAYYADLVLRLNRKSPIVGRSIPSKQLFSEMPGWYGWMLRTLPSHMVAVSMHAWIEGLREKPPSTLIYNFLARLDKEKMGEIQALPQSKKGASRYIRPERTIGLSLDKDYTFLKLAGDVSDTIIFDFLMDDHDRHRDHNWQSDYMGNLMIWDSGLILNHGPYAKDTCNRLLCGPDRWRQYEKEVLKSKSPCKKICRFRNSTIAKLKEMHYSNRTFGERLGAMVANDLIHPFEYQLYYVNQVLTEDGMRHTTTNAWPKVQFQREFMLDGIDRRVAYLFQHIEDCIDRFGGKVDKVLDARLDEDYKEYVVVL